MKKFNFINTNKSTRFFFILFVCITMIIAVMTGCDDDDSSQAKLFDAQQALDNGDWAQARAILGTLSTSEIVLQYLSNCETGELGINTFDILSTISDMENENGSINMIGNLIGNSSNKLVCTDTSDEITSIAVKLATIDEGIYNINQIHDLLGITLNADQTVQMGIASITRTVLIIAKMICEQTTGETEIELTETWINDNKADFLPFTVSTSWTSTYMAKINDDITNIVNAAAALTGENDIKDDLTAFKAEIDNGDGATAGDGIIDLSELNYYLDNM